MGLAASRLLRAAVGVAVLAGMISPAFQDRRPDAPADDPLLKQDLQMMQGKWETYTGSWITGGLIRIVKTVAGDTETVEYYYFHSGEKIRAHRDRIRLERMGDVTVFHYFDYTVIEGPGAGIIKNAPGGRYVYRVTPTNFFEVHGVFPGEENNFGVLVWRRIQ